MTQRIEATHFIEQYNIKPEYRGYNNEIVSLSPAPIGLMNLYISKTSKKISLQTLAVFKIKLK